MTIHQNSFCTEPALSVDDLIKAHPNHNGPITVRIKARKMQNEVSEILVTKLKQLNSNSVIDTQSAKMFLQFTLPICLKERLSELPELFNSFYARNYL